MRGAQALALLCACALVLAHERLDSEAEMSPMPFVFARYGRSQPRSPGGDRLIAQRNDKWALTTRYGKRNEFAIESPPSRPPRPPAPPGGELCCTYTGVLSLYTCTTNRAPEVRRNDELLSECNPD